MGILAISTCDRRKDSFYTFVLVWLDRPDLNLMFIVVAVREGGGGNRVRERETEKKKRSHMKRNCISLPTYPHLRPRIPPTHPKHTHTPTTTITKVTSNGKTSPRKFGKDVPVRNISPMVGRDHQMLASLSRRDQHQQTRLWCYGVGWVDGRVERRRKTGGKRKWESRHLEERARTSPNDARPTLFVVARMLVWVPSVSRIVFLLFECESDQGR